jgi:hypothetical protein
MNDSERLRTLLAAILAASAVKLWSNREPAK